MKGSEGVPHLSFQSHHRGMSSCQHTVSNPDHSQNSQSQSMYLYSPVKLKLRTIAGIRGHHKLFADQ